MFTVEFVDAANGVREPITLGMLAGALQADLEAKRLFAGVRARIPEVVGYFVYENGTQVAGFGLANA